ncbi:MAG: hypothetical protein ACRBN8_46035 [Nannocystales bacterium]
MDEIDEIIAYCTRIEPGFPQGLHGSSAADIAALEQALGKPCSPLYRKFLSTMGDGIDALQMGSYSTRPAELADRGADQLRGLVDGVELFAVSDLDDEDIFLVAREPRETLIVAHASSNAHTPPFDAEQGGIVAGSLSQLVCLPVFSRVRVLPLRYRAEFVATEVGPDYLVHLSRVAADVGAKAAWFSDSTAYVGEVESVVIVGKQSPTSYFSLGVAADDAWSCVAVLAALARAFDEAQLGLDRTR